MVLHWGESEVPWDSMATILLFFRANLASSTDHNGIAWISFLWYTYRDWEDLKSIPLYKETRLGDQVSGSVIDDFWTLLHTMRDTNCSNPRDKVYAFLNHPSAFDLVSGKPIVLPDYTKSVEQIYCEVAIAGLESRLSAVLCSISHPFGSLLNGTLPTWVPNYVDDDRPPSIITGGFNTCLDLKPDVAISNSKTEIHLGGLVFDSIEKITNETLSSLLLKLNQYFTGPSVAKHRRVAILQETMDFVRMTDTKRAYPRLSVDLITTLITAMSGSAVNPEANTLVYLADFYSYSAQLPLPLSTPDTRGSLTEAQVTYLASRGNALHFEQNTLTSINRKPFCTPKGYIGLAPEIAEEGDIVCVIFGCKFPIVLRPQGDHYLLLGACYVLGIMQGEAIEMMRNGELEKQVFEIH